MKKRKVTKAKKKVVEPAPVDAPVAPSPATCKTLTKKAEKAIGGLEDKCARGGCGHPRRMHIFNGVGEECHLCPCVDFLEV